MTSTNGSTSAHPLLDFCHLIAYNPKALSAFLDGFNPAPSAELHDALHSGSFDNVQAVLLKESANLIKVPLTIDDLRLNDGSANAGWVLSTLMDQINGGWTAPATQTRPPSP